MSDVNWTTPEAVRADLRRLWDRGRILVADLLDDPIFPYSLRFRRPDSRAMLAQFEDVRRWIQALEAESRAATGSGYEIEWTHVEHRQLGGNRVPSALTVPTRHDALRSLGKIRDAARFDVLAAETLQRFPQLRPWLIKKALAVLDHADAWERILAVVAWFCEHPRAGVYVRQIDVRGVDTKFIEARRTVISELLDIVLPSEVVDVSAGRQFEARYGLLAKAPLVRFRLLDPRHRLGGMSDITTPTSQFAVADLPVQRVFITENELNGLVFPDVAESIVIFGLGYGVELLGGVRWLFEKRIHYWGDIDTHGLAMLDRLRAFFPNADSLLMDRGTLDEHRVQWVEEAAQHVGQLARLTPPEAALYDDLGANRLGSRVRLEQERIGFHWLERALGEIR